MRPVPLNSLFQRDLQEVVLSVAVDEKRFFAFRSKIDGDSPGLIVGCHVRLDSHFYQVLS